MTGFRDGNFHQISVTGAGNSPGFLVPTSFGTMAYGQLNVQQRRPHKKSVIRHQGEWKKSIAHI
ncbi:hypothetical protein HYFRA_00005249 [Hymenoscyphus fraxineus]|uniref:Uncharacterized protein n=1 Tax=Hymenoscyphus fraxineus TaxID=746836 RepID=A0A9N9Q1X6_9HELO|nr:hypothetical protein HYFRA_00005249 [Hymenoscyphus fraxineus]